MDTLLESLDELFLKDKIDLAYETYSKFEQFKKTDSMSMTEYIVEYERLYTRCKRYDMTLPDAVLSFRLLDNSKLTLEQRQLALTAAKDLKFETMKTALKRIFTDIPKSCFTTPGACINIDKSGKQQEYAYYTRESSSKHKKTYQSNKLNPLNKYGKPSRCVICQSIYHWKKDCPHQVERTKKVNLTEHVEENESEECHITLFTKTLPTSEYDIFMVEAYGAAILDTACSKTVCGQSWLDNYVENISDSDKSKVISNSSKRRFRFGDGRTVQSTQLIKIPAKIGDVECSIETEVVPTNIPLLLSKTSLQRAGTVLDLKSDKATMFDKTVDLELTSSGHYCINIMKDDDVPSCSEQVLFNAEDMYKEETLRKLHRQFGHASADRMNSFLTRSGNKVDKDVKHKIKQIIDQCETCTIHKPTPLKPVVSLPLANDYNDTVAVDLHEIQPGLWYLHIIDLFSRFSAGCITKTKRSEVFVNNFLHYWVSIHGAPKKLFSDNGGEFHSSVVHDMAHNFNIEIKTTPAYSPWSNGILERHNKTLTEIMTKIKHDTECDWECALSWALMAKNSMCNSDGFSPYQLVFGRNPNLPSVYNDKPPALEGITNSEMIGAHIMAMYTARKAFAEAECSTKIRKAIRSQIRPTGNKFYTGQKVYYKKSDSPQWSGPGTVIGQDSVVVFVRHGGTYVRVHSSRIKLVQHNDITGSDIPAQVNSYNADNATDKNIDKNADTCIDYEDDNVKINDYVNNEMAGNNEHIQGHEQVTVDLTKLKSGQVIKFRTRDSGEQNTGKIISRATKASSKQNTWYNFEYIEPITKSGTKLSIDLSTVDDVQTHDVTGGNNNIENRDQEQSDDKQNDDIMIVNDICFDDAKSAELNNWKLNNVYEEVPDVGQTAISTRWVCTMKQSKDGITPKARLVARGFEDFENKNLPKDSPTCASESLRTVLTVISQQKWSVQTMDIQTAFLQGAELSRTVYIRPPVEAKTNDILWKLNKCVYGLVDASLFWYKRVCQVMTETGAQISKVDPAVFYWPGRDGEVIGVLACHVDDFIWGGTEYFENEIIQKIRNLFLIGKEEKEDFSYIGIDVTKCDDSMYLDQNKYIQNIQPIQIATARVYDKDASLNDKELENMRSKIGQLLWVGRQTRPDILYDVCMLASNLKSAKIKHLYEVNKVIRKVKSEDVSLRYRYLGDNKSLRLVSFSDASFGNLPDGATQGGNLIMLMAENGQCSPLFWQSKRIRRVVRSTLAGETIALTEGIDNAIFIATLFSELTTGEANSKLLPIICVVDNRSLCEAIKSNKCVAEKCLRLEIANIKELIKYEQINKVKWTDTKCQLADCLTKKGANTRNIISALRNGKWDIV